MNKEVWYRIFKDWCKVYWSIDQIEKSGICYEKEPDDLRMRLLKEIIETLEGETEDE